MRSSRNNLILCLLLSIALAPMACQRLSNHTNGRIESVSQRGEPQASTTDLLPFGNPSNAGNDADNYLLTHRSFTLSYNNSLGTLNWIAWWTRSADLGDRRERNRFEEDRSLPNSFRRVEYYDYFGSGYDRGHMVPAADRFGDEGLMEETFLMTNIVPQTGELNQFPWNKLESYARVLVRQGTEVYTIAGVYGENARLRGKVTVPTNCWKVIVVFPRSQPKETITRTTRIIAVDMPNVSGIENEQWEKYQTTVREIEQKTGLDLFSEVPRDVQDAVEMRAVYALPTE